MQLGSEVLLPYYLCFTKVKIISKWCLFYKMGGLQFNFLLPSCDEEALPARCGVVLLC